MHETSKAGGNKADEYPDEWWYKIYAAALLVNALVILALWAFSRHFSS
jgi:hypothetical protein